MCIYEVRSGKITDKINVFLGGFFSVEILPVDY